LNLHHVTLSLLLSAGPLRVACHASVGGERERPAEMCAVGERGEGEVERECAPVERAGEERPG
jgi:hypothetical protein